MVLLVLTDVQSENLLETFTRNGVMRRHPLFGGGDGVKGLITPVLSPLTILPQLDE
jgi:hypothetical protein